MIKSVTISLLILTFIFTACNTSRNERSQTEEISLGDTIEGTSRSVDSVVYASESLRIRQLSDHTYEHLSYLSTEDFGKVSCNGMIVVNGGDALVFDTPADERSSEELLEQLDKMGLQITAVLATHFHADCVAGLKQFHARNIPSYANTRTSAILDQQSSDTMPQNAFDDELKLMIGDKEVYARYFGKGHTSDNVVGYFPEDQALFGGCLIKEVDAGKGNLEDASTEVWSSTVEKIKLEYPAIKLVVPGHGKTGGIELLDYTIALFQ